VEVIRMLAVGNHALLHVSRFDIGAVERRVRIIGGLLLMLFLLVLLLSWSLIRPCLLLWLLLLLLLLLLWLLLLRSRLLLWLLPFGLCHRAAGG
jgi:uncharacterized membrane protein YjgN (DUF898 family)